MDYPVTTAPSSAHSQLLESLAHELRAPISEDAAALACAIGARHANAVNAIAFYGSCLRRRTSEGVHDFYVIVDDYRSAYRSASLAAVNALLPPNVFYLELDRAGVRLRAKYAVMSSADLAHSCRGGTRRASTWARFAQPVAAAFARDESARDALARACADAICTAVRAGLASRSSGWRADRPGDLWREIFRATYAAELRPEREGASDAIYAEQSARFDARLTEALAVLVESGVLERDGAGAVRVRTPLVRTAGRSAAAKWIGLLQLAKTAATFGDWVPYALWKVERHSGFRFEASERQRRHPWLFGWPLLFRVWRSGALR